MIYVLVRDAQDFDDCDGMIFASTSKKVVEKKHAELLEAHRVLQRFAKMCEHDMNLYVKDNPPPPNPDLSVLPVRPLVWNDARWDNAYVSEHNIEMRKYNDQLDKFRNHLSERLRTQYEFPKELISELDHIWFYLNDYTYSIVEVESD